MFREDEKQVDDNRPYISGWDTCDHSNVCKGWFKHGGLMYRWLQTKKYPTSTFGEPDESKISDEDKLRIETAHDVIGVIEDTIREELWEHAESLEESRKEFNKYIDGLQDALRLVGGVKVVNRYQE